VVRKAANESAPIKPMVGKSVPVWGSVSGVVFGVAAAGAGVLSVVAGAGVAAGGGVACASNRLSVCGAGAAATLA